MTGARETTRMLMARLERHYIKPGPMPGGVFVPECGLNNGGSQARCDALYVGFTSASGRLLVGHEVKASRADWRKELDTVGKADLWADNCHEWWIVAPGRDVVPAEEVPHGWGLMYPSTRSKTRMDKVLAPVRHADRQPSWLVMRSVLARLDTLRAQHDAGVRQKAVDDARAEHKRLQDLAARDTARGTLTAEQRDRLEVLARLEERLDVAGIRSWVFDQPDQIDTATAAAALQMVKVIDEGRIENATYAVDAVRRAAENMLTMLDDYEKVRASLLELAGKKDR